MYVLRLYLAKGKFHSQLTGNFGIKGLLPLLTNILIDRLSRSPFNTAAKNTIIFVTNSSLFILITNSKNRSWDACQIKVKLLLVFTMILRFYNRRTVAFLTCTFLSSAAFTVPMLLLHVSVFILNNLALSFTNEAVGVCSCEVTLWRMIR